MDDKYKNFPKLIKTMEDIIEKQVSEAERENEIQIRRYFNQEKEYVNTGHKNFTINIERKPPASDQPSELNILDFKNDEAKRKEFYNSRDLIDNMWKDDAIILEGCLKHLEIIQDSLSDKLKKIIHYEIFYSTKIFVEQKLGNALIDEWKQNKDVMCSDENQRKQIQKLEDDIKKNDQALEIISGMTRMIRNFQRQEKQVDQIHPFTDSNGSDDADSYIEDNPFLPPISDDVVIPDDDTYESDESDNFVSS